MTAGDEDSWDPFSDPEGEGALKSLADQLGAEELRALQEVSAGERIREVEVDRLARLGLLQRTSDGGVQLTQLGRDTLGTRT